MIWESSVEYPVSFGPLVYSQCRIWHCSGTYSYPEKPGRHTGGKEVVKETNEKKKEILKNSPKQMTRTPQKKNKKQNNQEKKEKQKTKNKT